MTYEKNQIRERYLKNYITDSQLMRFKELNIITSEQYDNLYAEKHQIGIFEENE